MHRRTTRKPSRTIRRDRVVAFLKKTADAYRKFGEDNEADHRAADAIDEVADSIADGEDI